MSSASSPTCPANTVSYDDASNNKAFVAGSAALIWNPPSAWAVAKRDAPAIAADTWHFPNPRGKMGRLVPHRPYFWGIWQWAQNKSGGKRPDDVPQPARHRHQAQHSGGGL